MGRAVSRVRDPKDTKPLTAMTAIQMRLETSVGKKARGMNTPMLVATALPPLKPMKTEKTCPRTAARPTTVTEAQLPPSHRASRTGSAPLAMSQARTATPQPKPHSLATLVAPVLRLPSFLGSMPQNTRAIISPHGQEPSR